MSKVPEVSIIIPAFNESGAIENVVKTLTASYPDYEVIVVDDGSTDGTGKIAAESGANVVTHRENRGYGRSWKSGIELAAAPILVFFDGDNQMYPEDIGRLLLEMQISGADMVSGARKSGASSSLARRPGKVILRWLGEFMVGRSIPDLNCGLRAVKKDVLTRYIHLLPNGFSASTTSLMAFLQRGYFVRFIPVEMKKRIGTSSVRLISDGFGTLLLILRMVALFNPLRFFIPVSIGMFIFAIVYSFIEIIRLNMGIPVLGAVVFIGSLQIFMTGIVCDQVSALRLERFELPSGKTRQGHPVE
jgi:glycosyltransferase involved in cell wall biosynthesis